MSKKKTTDSEKEVNRLEYVFEKGINFKHRIIQITGEIEDQQTFDYLDAALTEMERCSKKSITIKINSPGGSVYEALAMVDRIKESSCQIVTKCYGHAMSAATLVLAAGDKRLMGSRAWFMHHESSTTIGGALTNLKQATEQMNREEEQWATAMEEFTIMPREYWIEEAKSKNLYLSAQECLEAGIIDELF